MPRPRAASTSVGVKAGWLAKKGQVNKSSKKRWFVLRRVLNEDDGRGEYELAYYKGPDSGASAGSVVGHSSEKLRR